MSTILSGTKQDPHVIQQVFGRLHKVPDTKVIVILIRKQRYTKYCMLHSIDDTYPTGMPVRLPSGWERVTVRTDLANRSTGPMLVSFRARYTKLWGNRGFLQSGSRQTTPVLVGVTCGSGISVVQVGRE